MRQLFIIVFLFFTVFHSSAQQPDAKELMKEGIALNDQGDYENAIKKYDQVLAMDADNFNALYEKSNTLTYLKKYDDCIDISKQLIKKFPDEPQLKLVYVVYGSAVDYTGNSKEAIKIYDEGLKKFPGYFLLLFNKAITLQSIDKNEDAYKDYQLALISNPLHASSYLRISRMLKQSNKIPALLAAIMQLICEPDGDRAVAALQNVKELTYGNITQNGKGNTITISLPSDTKKKQPDDFSTVEMMFSLMAAASGDTAVNKISTNTEIDKFDFVLQMLISSLGEGKKEKGFFWERYAPFFVELKKKEFTNIVSRLVYKTSGDDANIAWLQTHTDKVNEFYTWLQSYKWPDQK